MATTADTNYGLAARALAAANRAIALDSTLPEAWGVRGYIQLYASAPPPETQAGLRRAIQLRPGYSEAHGWLGQSIAYSGGSAVEAMVAGNKSLELDPASIGMRLGYVGIALATRDHARALENARAIATLRPEFEAITSNYEGPALIVLGRAEECLRVVARPMLRPICLVGVGQRQAAKALVDSLVAHWERGSVDSFAMSHLSGYFGLTGQVDEFIKWVTRSFERVPLAVSIENGGLNDAVLRAEGGRARIAYERLRQTAWDRIVRESREVRLP
jgi:tetratricopeptide (TPR) repeat protein